MKKIGKLSINPEKEIEKTKLKNLRGGASWYLCTCSSGGYTYFEEEIRLESWAIDRYLENTCWEGHDGECTPI
jgi:natural product precursor